MKTPETHNLFTCTFCYHLSAGPPHVLGRSARLACAPCHAALLDLSICWVCGELVFRGDECVSLGWCFWHRACYGCLLCGSHVVYKGVPGPALFKDKASGVKKRCGGVREVTEVPLCVVCVVEAEVDGLEEEAVVQRGLRRVDKVDGGVTRKRWEVKEKARGSKATRTRRTVKVCLRSCCLTGVVELIPGAYSLSSLPYEQAKTE